MQANDLDLIAITETWFKPDDISVVRASTPSGFSFHHIPRSVKTGGGVGLLYRSTLSINVTAIHFDYSTFQSIHCELTCNSLSVRLVVIYRPIKTISGQHVNFTNFLREFENLINDYLLHPSELILTGDFNIHVDDESNSTALKFTDLLTSYGFIQHITGPTHCNGHCLDLFITRESAQSLVTDIALHPGLSDHFAIFASLFIKKPPTPTVSVSSRRLKNINILQFCKDVDVQLSALPDFDNDLDNYVNAFEETLQKVMDVHAPKKTFVKKLNSTSPWFNDDIRAARKVRRQLERKWRDNGKLEIHRQEYCKQRDIVAALIKQAKIQYYSNEVTNCYGDQKRLFGFIDKLLHKSNEPVLPSAVSDQSLAGRFSQFFCGKN